MIVCIYMSDLVYIYSNSCITLGGINLNLIHNVMI